MSWLFSQALVEEYSQAICSDGEQFVPLKSSHTQQVYCSPDKMTKYSRLSRYGMTFVPLTENHGEELLTLYLADFHAKTSAQRAAALALKASAAGRGAGIKGERSGLWKEFARIIGEVRPKIVFVENSPMLTIRGLGIVLGDLSELGFYAEWGIISAADVGAPHLRKRIWIVGHTNNDGQTAAEIIRSIESGSDYSSTRAQQTSEPERSSKQYKKLANTEGKRIQRDWENGKQITQSHDAKKISMCGSYHGRSWPTEPDMGRVVNGMAARVDRLKAIGNGQVPRVAATAFNLLIKNNL